MEGIEEKVTICAVRFSHTSYPAQLQILLELPIQLPTSGLDSKSHHL